MQQIGRYNIVRELGHGAMGVVYEAIDTLMGRHVAIKTILLTSLGDRNESEFLRDRLFREARSAGLLSHPGIVTVLDMGQHDDTAFIVMELVDGPTLEQILASNRRLARAEIFGILRQAAVALDYAHKSGVIHRDIKPANIMLHKGTIVKIADFGIAKVTETQFHTRTGMMLGTPSYMSPEQIKGDPLDGRSDQFSLAVVAFEMLTGARPFKADTLPPLVHMIVYEPRPSARVIDNTLPLAIDVALKAGLAQRPEDRFSSCAEFVTSLEAALSAPASNAAPAARPISKLPAVADRKRRTLVPRYAILGVLALVGVTGALLYKFGGSKPTSAPPPTIPAASSPPPSATKPTPPKIIEFRTMPSLVRKGEQFRLNWNVQGASSVSIDQDVGHVTMSGTRRLSAASTTTYTLEAVGPGGRVHASTELTVPRDPPPEISDFKAVPESIESGGSAVVVWNVTNASSVTIDGKAVPARGSLQVHPTTTTTYIIKASGAGGEATNTVTLRVSPLPTNTTPVPTKSETPKRINVGTAAMEARLLQRVQPVYPQAAKDAKVQGTVRFRAVVGVDGKVRSLTPFSGPYLLIPEATQAAKQWVFQPVVVNQRAVEVNTEIDIKFVLPE